MTAQQLKASILQLAIQGKLVPQNPVDEPASVLLRRIKAEKDVLVKAGKLKKDKHESVIIRNENGRFLEKKDGKTTDITDEIPFDIPDSWEWARLKSFADSCLGKMLDAQKNKGSLMPYLRNVNVRWHSFDLSDLLQMRFEQDELERYEVIPGDLIVCEGGEPGRCAVWTEKTGRMRIQKALHRIRPFHGISSSYLAYVIQLYSNNKYLSGFFTGTTIKHLTGKALDNLLFPLPSQEEQARIVAKIEGLLPHVEEYGKAETALSKLNTELPEQLKKSILQWAIQGHLVPQDPTDEPASELLKRIKAEKAALIKSGKLKKDKKESLIIRNEDGRYLEKKDGQTIDITDEIPFDIPDTWAWARLNTITTFLHRGKSPKYTDIKRYPMFAQKCNKKDGIHMENALFCVPEYYNRFSPEYQLQDSDVVINSTGTGTLGRVGIFYKSFLGSFESTVPDSHVTLVRACQPYIVGEYLFACFRAPFYQGMLLRNADGSTNQKELYTKALENFLLPIPPLAEQKRIVKRIETLNSTYFFRDNSNAFLR